MVWAIRTWRNLSQHQRDAQAGRRRDLLTVAGASLAALAAPRIGRAQRPNKLVFVPTSDLAVLDPVVPSNRPTRNHAYLVFDTLYGIDTNWTAQPQMVEEFHRRKPGNPSLRLPTAPVAAGAFCHGCPQNQTMELAGPGIRGMSAR